MPTLSEAAKSILEKNNNLAESNDPTPDRDAQQMTPNAQTLRPMSKGGELGRVVNPKSNPPMGDADDEMEAVDSPQDQQNLGAIFSKNINKDTGWQHKPAMPVSQTAPQGLAEDEEIEISEELQEFIDDMLEEGYSEDEILEAIEENFEVIEEEGTKKPHFVTNEPLRKQPKEVQKAVREIAAERGLGKIPSGEHLYKELGHKEFRDALQAKGIRSAGTVDGDGYHQIIYGRFSEDVIEEEGKGKNKTMEEIFGNAPEYKGPKLPRDNNKNPNLDTLLGRKASPKSAIKRGEKPLKEAIDALLEGEDFSDDFRTKATAIFEAAVADRVNDIKETLEEAYAAAIEEEVENIQNQITEQVDSYLNYAVQEWINENEVAIETGLRTEITEEFMSGLKNLFAEHYIDMPEDKVNVVEELANEVKSLRGKLNEETERNIQYRKSLSEASKYIVVNEACEGLTDTEAAKLRSLVENISYEDGEEFHNKVYALRESYFPGEGYVSHGHETLDPDTGKNVLNEEVGGRMGDYVKVIGKTLPN